jgi:TRAP-type C4-dicarboxylate transport system permease small subunit
MNLFMRGLIAVNKALFAVSMICLGAGTGLATLNAITRKFFPELGGFTWAEEMATYFCVLMLFTGVAYLELTNKHLTIGVIDSLIKNERIRSALNRILWIFRGVVTIVLLCIVLRYGFIVLQSLWAGRVLTFALRVPKVYFFIPMLVGFAIAVLVWLSILIVYKGKEIKFGADMQ